MKHPPAPPTQPPARPVRPRDPQAPADASGKSVAVEEDPGSADEAQREQHRPGRDSD